MKSAITSLYLIAIICSPLVAIAEPYAKALDISNVKDSYFKFKLKGFEIPDKSAVPLPAYENSVIFDVVKIRSSADGLFQENRIISLATGDSIDAVISYYRTQIANWKFHKLKNYSLFLESGDQLFWGGGERLLVAPRVHIQSLESTEGVIDHGIVKLKSAFPEMKTLIKIYYEHSVAKQSTTDISSLFKQCLEKEEASKKKITKETDKGPEVDTFIKNMVKNTCDKVKSTCEKDISSTRCQGYIRKYE